MILLPCNICLYEAPPIGKTILFSLVSSMSATGKNGRQAAFGSSFGSYNNCIEMKTIDFGMVFGEVLVGDFFEVLAVFCKRQR